MYGNVFYRSAGGQFGGIQIHGGKDNISDNNLFIECKSAFSFSPWNEKRWLEGLDGGQFARIVRNTGVDITKEPFVSRYPDYKNIRENANRNYMLRNLAVNCGVFARNDRGQNVQTDNISVLLKKPELDALGRFVIPYDWSVYSVNKMRPIPTQKMGLYVDPLLRKTVEKTDVTPRYVLE